MAPKASTKGDGAAKKEDAILVKRAQAGDRDAFRQLFERYHQRAYALAMGVVRHPQDAQDVVQDAFIKAHRYLPKFEGTSSFYTWFYRIVMNLSIDYIRKRKRGRAVEYNDAISGAEQSELEDNALLPRILGEDPGRSLYRKEIRGQISTALEELSDNHRSVLVMREIEGMSYDEMADIMNCSKGTIMSRLFHARKNMQIVLLELMDGAKGVKS